MRLKLWPRHRNLSPVTAYLAITSVRAKVFLVGGWKKIMESLTVEQRETLILHFFEGYTFEEIARKQGQSYANVRNHHYRGLNKIRRHLAEVGSQNR